MFKVHIQGHEELPRILAEMRGRAESVDQYLPVVAEMLVASVSDVFEAEGPGWEPLADSTRMNPRRADGPILQDTGVAAGSVGPAWGDVYAEAVGGVDYLLYHVTGTSKMPKRNPFDLGPFEGPLLDEVSALLLENLT